MQDKVNGKEKVSKVWRCGATVPRHPACVAQVGEAKLCVTCVNVHSCSHCFCKDVVV